MRQDFAPATQFEEYKMKTANPWKRLGAFFLDSIIGFILLMIVSAAFPDKGESYDLARGLGVFGVFGLGILYFTFMESTSLQATLGKLALGMVVTDKSGAKLGFGQALVRGILKVLTSIFTLNLGFAAVLINKDGSAIHDSVAGSIVAEKESNFFLEKDYDISKDVRLQRLIFEIAKSGGGTVTPSNIVMTTNFTYEQAKKILEMMTIKGICAVEVDDAGKIHYIFKEIAQ